MEVSAPARGSAVEKTVRPGSETVAASHRIVIEPASGWQLVDFRELWRFHELLYYFSLRNIKIRYKQTVLGAAWAILQPAMMMVVFTVFFNRLGKLGSGDVPYPLFACAGLLAWMYFSAALASAGNSVVGSEGIISKIYFPRLLIPMSAIASAFVDFLVACGLLAFMMAYYKAAPSPQLPIALLAVGALTANALGFGTLLAALNVTYRDFRYVAPFMIQILMFATPSIYMALPLNPSGELRLLSLNPLAGLIQAFRAGVLGGEIPWFGLGVGWGVGLAAMTAGFAYFRRVEDTFADVI